MKRKPDPLLRTQPWKVQSVFQPIEQTLHRIEVDGTVDTCGAHVVFREDGAGGWYDLVAALRGVIEFQQIAAARMGWPDPTEALVRFANKLHSGSPLFEADLRAVRGAIAACKHQALQLRVSQAEDILQTVRISTELEIAREAA